MIRLALALVVAPLVAQAAPPVCTEPAEPAPQMKLAVVAGKPITRADVDAQLGDALCAERMEYARKVHEMRTQALESLVADRLIEIAAKAAGAPDAKAWLAAEIGKGQQAPTNDDVKAFYDQNQDKMGGRAFEEVAQPIAAYLAQQGQQAAYAKILDGLKATHKVETLLPPFRLPVDATGPSQGNAKATITMVEFADYECGFCARARDTVKAVQAKYGDKLRLVFRDFPLEFHANARPAAIAARCAAAQNKFWEMHDALFANSQGLGDATYKRLAGEVGLDAAAFDKCVADPATAAALETDMLAGRKVGVSGTPAFFINGISLSGAQPLEAFTAIIDAELARGSK